MHAACRPTGLALAWFTGQTTRSSLLSALWPEEPSPLPDLDWEEWAERWVDGASRPSRWIVGLPADRRRARFHLLVTDTSDRPIAFAKFTTNQERPHVVEARRALESSGPKSYWTPRLLGQGTIGGWSFTLDEPIPTGFHGPARLTADDRMTITREIQVALAPRLRPPAGEAGMHGDFGPWNVRRLADGRIAVLDWEEVTTGPKAADSLWHSVHVALLRRRRSSAGSIVAATGASPPDAAAAARFWLERLAGPQPDEVTHDVDLSRREARLLRLKRHTLERIAAHGLL